MADTIPGTYALVTPVRDEEEFVERTLASVVAQTILPALWVIVDDGSTDGTPEIVEGYAAKHDWIRLVRRGSDGVRRVGGGVVLAFNQGWEIARESGCEFVCKLDGDLIMPPGYFAEMLALMAADPRLGTVSGKAWYPGASNVAKSFDGELISEKIQDDVSVGAAKFYRVAALDDIGGLEPMVMWDGIDCYKMRMLGWRAASIDLPRLRFIHLRPMGSSDRGILTGRRRHGLGHWFMRSSFPFFFVSVLRRLPYRPVLMGSLAILQGYFQAMFSGAPRLADRELGAYIRRYQRAILTLGRTAAKARFEADGEAVWQHRLADRALPPVEAWPH